jgi:hypothetical protein
VKRSVAPVAGASAAGTAFSSMALARSLRQLAGPLSGSQLCVAFSGGLDSTALLVACAALRVRCRCQVRAVHVNHHLQPSARSMAASARTEAASELLQGRERAGRYWRGDRSAGAGGGYAALRGELRLASGWCWHSTRTIRSRR